VLGFHAAVAAFALLMLVRHLRRGLALFAPRGRLAPGERAAALVPALVSATALLVLATAVKALLAGLR
jgi:hypothetical protein